MEYEPFQEKVTREQLIQKMEKDSEGMDKALDWLIDVIIKQYFIENPQDQDLRKSSFYCHSRPDRESIPS